MSNIVISDHVCHRFIQRFNPNIQTMSAGNQLEAARKALTVIVAESNYLSDNSKGVLLFSRSYNALLIIKDRVLKTIYTNCRKIKNREKKAGK